MSTGVGCHCLLQDWNASRFQFNMLRLSHKFLYFYTGTWQMIRKITEIESLRILLVRSQLPPQFSTDEESSFSPCFSSLLSALSSYYSIKAYQYTFLRNKLLSLYIAAKQNTYKKWLKLATISGFLRSLKKKIVKELVTQSYPTLCNPMDSSPSGSSVHGILQARML